MFGESRERYSLEVGAEGPALIKEVGWVVMSTGKLIVAVKWIHSNETCDGRAAVSMIRDAALLFYGARVSPN